MAAWRFDGHGDLGLLEQIRSKKLHGCWTKNRGGKHPQIIHLFIGFGTIIFTIHFGVFPLFLETPTSAMTRVKRHVDYVNCIFTAECQWTLITQFLRPTPLPPNVMWSALTYQRRPGVESLEGKVNQLDMTPFLWQLVNCFGVATGSAVSFSVFAPCCWILKVTDHQLLTISLYSIMDCIMHDYDSSVYHQYNILQGWWSLM